MPRRNQLSVSRSMIEPLENRLLMTVLTFEKVLTAGGVPQPIAAADLVTYGDRVTGSSQGQFRYGTTNGPTPKIVADFTPKFSSGIPNIGGWAANYGDLKNNIWSGDPSKKIVVSLKADAGYNTQLFGFDLGGWPNADYTIKQVKVEGGGKVLFTQSNVVVHGDAVGPKHTAFTFAAPLTASEIKITIDNSNISPYADIGLDNVKFGQAVVPPGSFATVVSGQLRVVGTTGNDTITVTKSGTNLVAKLGTVTKSFPATGITSVDVKANSGNDQVSLGAGVPKASIDGGSGNDVLAGGDGNDTVLGGSGNDVLFGGKGIDKLDGGDNDDTIFARGDSAIDNVIGGNGFDVGQLDANDTKSLVEILLA